MTKKPPREGLETRVKELEKKLALAQQEKETAQAQCRQFRAILAATPDFIVLKDPNFIYRIVNRSFCDFLSKSEEEIVGKTDFDLFPPQEAEIYRRGDTKVLKSGTPQIQDEVATGSSGKKHLRVAKTPVLDEAGNHLGLLCAVWDITEQKQLEEALCRSEERFRTFADFTSNWEYWIDPEGNYVYISPSCERITGYSADEFRNDPELLLAITHQDDRPRVARHLKEDFLSEHDFAMEFRIITKGGEERWIAHLCQPVYDASGNHLGRRESNRDITERKTAEATIKQYSQTQTIINQLLGLLLKDLSLENILDQFIEYITSFPWLGVEPSGAIFLVEEETNMLVLRSSRNVPHGLLTACSRVPFGKCLCGKAALSRNITFANQVSKSHETVYDDIYPHGHYCVPILSVTGEVLGVYSVFLDDGCRRDEKVEETLIAVAMVLAGIIERKRAQEALQKAHDELEHLVEERTLALDKTRDQLLHAEKLSAVGKLSASIAHEFNNPLSGIRNVLAGIKRRASLDEDDGELVTIALQECDRIKYLIKDLQNFYRPTKRVKKPMDLHKAIDNTLLLIKKEFTKNNIKVKKKYTPNLPNILAVTDRIRQVLLNLLNNAQDACEEGGTIKITTGAQDGNVILRVQDNGKGINKEDMAHIFEPFFTTKPEGKGTGLGLSVSYDIIKRHGGTIEVDSKKGRGTTFTVTLPVESRQITH